MVDITKRNYAKVKVFSSSLRSINSKNSRSVSGMVRADTKIRHEQISAIGSFFLLTTISEVA